MRMNSIRSNDEKRQTKRSVQSSALTSQEVRAQYQRQAQEDHSRDFGRVLSYNCGQNAPLALQHGQRSRNST